MDENKILGILPASIGGRLTISSIFDGFKQNGYTVDIFDELSTENFNQYIKSNYKYIVGYGFSPVILKQKYDLHLTSINYFSDVIESKTSGAGELWEKYLYNLNEPNNYNFYWDRELSILSNINNLYYMPHFVNTEIYKDLKLEKKDDIMFAGRLDTDLRLNTFIDLMHTFPELNFSWYAIQKHYDDALKRTEYKDLIKKAYKGFIDNECDMAKALNQAKIVFNINAQGISSLNYRTFQAAACKTLVISDYRTECGQLFQGKMPYYADFEDLVSKIKYFLQNQNAYNTAVNGCYDIVKIRHNSKICVKMMLNVIH